MSVPFTARSRHLFAWVSILASLAGAGCESPAPMAANLVLDVPPGAQTTEAGTQATFTVRLDRQPHSDVTVPIASSDPSEGTVSPASLVFTRDNWSAPQTVVVTGVDDDVADGTQTFEIVLGPTSSEDEGLGGMTRSVEIDNVDDESPGITVSQVAGDVDEGGAQTTFTVVLHSEPIADVTVTLASDDPSEGTIAPATLTFTSVNWNAPQVVAVTGADDDVADGTQTFGIAVTSVTSADLGYDGIDLPGAISVDNVDDDSAGIVAGTPSGDTGENGATATFTLVLTSEPTADVVLTLGSSDPGEGAVTSATTITFTNENWNAPQTVTVTGQSDDLVDGNQGYDVVATIASSDASYDALEDVHVTLSNVDDDTADVRVSLPSGDTTEAGGTATFTIVLTSEPTADVTVSFDTDDAGEGTLDRTSVTFTPGTWDDAQTVTITGEDDDLDDGDQPYQIVFADVASTDALYDVLLPANVVVQNDDDDSAGIDVAAVSGHTTEAGGTATFTIVLTSEPTADVTVSFDTDDAGEGTLDRTSVTFTPGTWDDAQTVTVTGEDDDLDDGDQPYQVDFTATTSTDAAYAAITPLNLDVVNDDDDSADIQVSIVSGHTTEAAGTATFTIVLTSEPTADVTVFFDTDDAGEGTLDRTSVTFMPGTWDDAQTVTITGEEDDLDDGDQPYQVDFTATTTMDAVYAAITPSSVSVTNDDDDTAGFAISAISGRTSEAGASATFTVALESEPTGDVVLTFASNDPDEGTTDVTTLTFTPADWSDPQTVTVTGANDTDVDGAVDFDIVFDPASSTDSLYDGMVPDPVTVTNDDDDGVCLCGGDDFEDGDAAGWTPISQTLAVITPGANGSNHAITVTGGNNTHLTGVSYSLPGCLVTRFSVSARPSTTTAAHNYILLGGDTITANNAILFLYATTSGWRIVNDTAGGNNFSTVVPDVWTRFDIEIDWTTRTVDVYQDGVLEVSDFAFRSATVTSLTRIHFYNFSNAVGTYDEIELETDCP